MQKEKQLPHFELTGIIMQCCFEVMKELGPGFLERIYINPSPKKVTRCACEAKTKSKGAKPHKR
jgi:hypothetical protein